MSASSGQRARMRDVWAKVPDVACKDLCAASCGPIGASRLEMRLLERRGVHLEAVDVIVGRWVRLIEGGEAERRPVGEWVEDCPALVEDRCSAYDVRPTVCRLWGAVENMPCPWGCERRQVRIVEAAYAQLRREHLALLADLSRLRDGRPIPVTLDALRARAGDEE